MQPMNPKTEKSLRLLVAIKQAPQSSVQLADTLTVSRPTVVRLVEDLRALGCQIESVRDGMEWSYHLHDWGVFDPERVIRFVQEMPQEGKGAAPICGSGEVNA